METKYTSSFYEEGIFHVYNRTNNKEPLFRTFQNRLYFLQLYARYVQPFADTFCWCLLPNHFHFLIRVKREQQIKDYLLALATEKQKSFELKFLAGDLSMELLLEQEWKRFFTAYAMAFNKEFNRRGNLFHRPFKRLEVEKESYFTHAVVYIHANAMKHKLCKDVASYQWSSWHTMMSDQPTLLRRQELLDWFGGRDHFIKHHHEQAEEQQRRAQVFLVDQHGQAGQPHDDDRAEVTCPGQVDAGESRPGQREHVLLLDEV